MNPYAMAGKRLGKARASGVPNDATERKIRILLELIRNKFVRISRLSDDYGTSARSLLRDFQELRKIGQRAGFRLSEKSENDQIRLLDFDARPTAIDKNAKALRTLIHDAAHALGTPVEAQLETLEGESAGERAFLRFLTPTLSEGTRVAQTFEQLQSAWANNARVTFRYTGKERCVEPACVYARSGRYFLLCRDTGSRSWKYYALDNIVPPVKRAGSFTPQPIPERYRDVGVIGFLQGSGEHRVSVWLSPALAPSAASRVWQRDQQIETHADKSATITFTLSDVGEVIRWALGFGAEARVVAPPDAVRQAREVVEAIAAEYRSPSA